jgi:hypothetical protein
MRRSTRHLSIDARPLQNPGCPESDIGSTYLMEREAHDRPRDQPIRGLANEAPREFAIRATAGPTPFLYRYSFSSENDETVLELDGNVELPGAAAVLPQLARRAVKNGVDDNLATLKRILELGSRDVP